MLGNPLQQAQLLVKSDSSTIWCSQSRQAHLLLVAGVAVLVFVSEAMSGGDGYSDSTVEKTLLRQYQTTSMGNPRQPLIKTAWLEERPAVNSMTTCHGVLQCFCRKGPVTDRCCAHEEDAFGCIARSIAGPRQHKPGHGTHEQN